MKKLMNLFFMFFLVITISAMELEQKVEEKRFEVATLQDIAARYVAVRLCNPMYDQAMALSFVAGENAKYLDRIASRKFVAELAYDAVEHLEKIFPTIPAQLVEKRELSWIEGAEFFKIRSLDKKWWARSSGDSTITMGNDTESKNIPIPLAAGYAHCVKVSPCVISKDNRICLANGIYVMAADQILNEYIGIDYDKEKVIYRYPLAHAHISKDRSFFVGKDDNGVLAYSLGNGARLYQLEVPDCDDKTKITLSKNNEHILISINNKLYVCDGSTGELEHALGVKNKIEDYCLSNDERSVAIMDQEMLSIGNVYSGNTISTMALNGNHSLNGFYADDRFVITDGVRTEGVKGIYSYLWDIVKQKMVAKKSNTRREYCEADKSFIYCHIAKTLTLEELIALLALSKQKKDELLDENLLAIIRKSKCQWLKEHYKKPWLCSVM